MIGGSGPRAPDPDDTGDDLRTAVIGVIVGAAVPVMPETVRCPVKPPVILSLIVFCAMRRVKGLRKVEIAPE